LAELRLWKWLHYLNQSTDSMQFSSKLNVIFHRSRYIWPKIHTEIEKTPNSKSNPEQTEQCWGITIPDFKLYYRAIVTKTAYYWHKNRCKGQWNRIDNPKITHIATAIWFLSKVAKNTHWRTDSWWSGSSGKMLPWVQILVPPPPKMGEQTASSTNSTWNIDYLHAEVWN
jgi:hypothetical protein